MGTKSESLNGEELEPENDNELIHDNLEDSVADSNQNDSRAILLVFSDDGRAPNTGSKYDEVHVYGDFAIRGGDADTYSNVRAMNNDFGKMKDLWGRENEINVVSSGFDESNLPDSYSLKNIQDYAESTQK